MRRIFVVVLLCLCSSTMYGQKTRYGQTLPYAKHGVDYLISVHINGTHRRRECNYNEFAISSPKVTCKEILYADAIVDGKKMELMGDGEVAPFNYIELPLGDYQARLLEGHHKMRDSPFYQKYDILFPDKHIWRCVVTGVSE